jgi:hypothetical protein
MGAFYDVRLCNDRTSDCGSGTICCRFGPGQSFCVDPAFMARAISCFP